MRRPNVGIKTPFSALEDVFQTKELHMLLQNLDVEAMANLARTNKRMQHRFQQLAESDLEIYKSIMQQIGLGSALFDVKRGVLKHFEQEEFGMFNAGSANNMAKYIFQHDHTELDAHLDNKDVRRFCAVGRNVFRAIKGFWFSLPVLHVPYTDYFKRPHKLTSVCRFKLSDLIEAALEVRSDAAEDVHHLSDVMHKHLLWVFGDLILFLQQLSDPTDTNRRRVPLFGEQWANHLIVDEFEADDTTMQARSECEARCVECIIDRCDLSGSDANAPSTHNEFSEDVFDLMLQVFDIENTVEWNATRIAAVRSRHGPKHAAEMEELRKKDHSINVIIFKHSTQDPETFGQTEQNLKDAVKEIRLSGLDPNITKVDVKFRGRVVLNVF